MLHLALFCTPVSSQLSLSPSAFVFQCSYSILFGFARSATQRHQGAEQAAEMNSRITGTFLSRNKIRFWQQVTEDGTTCKYPKQGEFETVFGIAEQDRKVLDEQTYHPCCPQAGSTT